MLLAGLEINNRDLPDPVPADLCLENEDNHKNILHRGPIRVNDGNQVRYVLIVLDNLSDKQL